MGLLLEQVKGQREKEGRNLEDVANGGSSGFHNFVVRAAKVDAAKVCAFQFWFEALRNLDQAHGQPVLPTEVPEFMGNFGFMTQVVDAVLVDLGVNGVHAGLRVSRGGCKTSRAFACVSRSQSNGLMNTDGEGRLKMPSQVSGRILHRIDLMVLEGVEMTCEMTCEMTYPTSEGIFA
jgi:hypothetical protein